MSSMPSVINFPRFHIPDDLFSLMGKRRPLPDQESEVHISHIPHDDSGTTKPLPTRESICSYEKWSGEGVTKKLLSSGIIWKDLKDGQLRRTEGVPATTDINELPASPPLPRNHLFPPWKSDTTHSPMPIPSDACIKGQDISDYDPSMTPAPAAALSAEVELLEFLRVHPHPNVVHFYGCIRIGDLLTSACLRRNKCTLECAMNGNMFLSSRRVTRGIRAALKHLHSLGIAHGNLNVANTMLSDTGDPVVINFERACRRAQTPYSGREERTLEPLQPLLQLGGAAGGDDQDPHLCKVVCAEEFERATQEDYEALQAIEREIDAYARARWRAKVQRFLSVFRPASLPLRPAQWGRVVHVLTNILVPIMMFIA
ncbi:hypothetical protein OF83DRAFT_1171622 [Amylostereum chailletii]|nr:hypothetical protein OF83DRAFT_1171622 [Amylostereum chailletii]